MIHVRVQVIYGPRRILWSEPISNRAALEAFTRHLARKKRHPDNVLVFDDPEHHLIADACFEIAAPQGEVFEVEFGPRVAGRRQYIIALAPLPAQLNQPVPVVGGFPLLDTEPEKEARPRRRRRTQHWPDVRYEPAEPAAVGHEPGARSQDGPTIVVFRPVQPTSWLARLVAWFVGTPIPEEA